MPCPELTIEQVQQIITQASDIEYVGRGGQKIVFSGIIDDYKYAFKFIEPNLSQEQGQNGEPLDVVIARAKCEVETSRQCSTPYLVDIGPIGLESAEIDDRTIIYFSEEFIEGRNLQEYLQEDGTFSPHSLVLLAFNISEAISAIWRLRKVHRDIKPGNIMVRNDTGTFVLLDMGFVLDLQGDSLSAGPVGSFQYFSPEHTDFNNRKRTISFKSDMFSLGTVMYEMATGKNPFTESVSNPWEVIDRIANVIPIPPIELRPDLPENLSELIMRLLAKRPALRYRTIDKFQSVLREVETEGDRT